MEEMITRKPKSIIQLIIMGLWASLCLYVLYNNYMFEALVIWIIGIIVIHIVEKIW